jgi:regulator of protease activity HflC (stomatin/prohibitin superfamily)
MIPNDKEKMFKILSAIAFVIFILKPQLFFSLAVIAIIGYVVYLKTNKSGRIIDLDSQNNNFINILKNFNINNLIKNMQKSVGLVAVIVILIITLFQAITIIPPGVTGVYHLFGKVSDQELRSGFHIINPLADVEKMSVRTEEYTMSIAHGEGNRVGADAIDALTKEGLKVVLDITVLYHMEDDKASTIFKELGTNFAEKLIRPQIRSVIREVIAQYEAKDIYSSKREEASQNILERLKTEIGGRGIVVEDVLLRNINLPDKLEASIQDKLTAEQDAERYSFILDKEKKEKERKIIEAEGQRDAQKIINESLSEQYLQYLYIQGLKDRQGTIYVPTDPNNGLPVFKGL